MMTTTPKKRTGSWFVITLLLASICTRAESKPDRIIPFKQVDDITLKLHVFEPEKPAAKKKSAAVVFFFGGGWTSGNPNQFYGQCEHLANQGMVAISAEYRVKNKHNTTPHESLKDAVSALRWVRLHADELGIDPQRIAAAGGSAGGHLAAAIVLCDGYDEPNEELSIFAKPNALVLFNPALDLGPDTFANKRVAPNWKPISPMHNIHSNAPPTLIMLGTEDKLIPVESAEHFTQMMKEAGNDCRLVLYEGQPHGFFNKARYDETLQESTLFLKDLGYLDSTEK